MKTRKILALLLALCAVFTLCACGSKNTEQKNGEVTYTVKVADEAGKPVSGVVLQLCSDSCMLGETNAEGVATFEVGEADYKVIVFSVPAGYAADPAEYHFEAGKYEMKLTLKEA